MLIKHPTILYLLLTAACMPTLYAATFNIAPTTTPQTNTTINPGGLSNGDIIIVDGNIIVTGADAIDFTPVPSNLSITINTGVTVQTNGTSEGLDFSSTFDGSLTVLGSVITKGTGNALDFDGDLNGTVTIGTSGILNGGGHGVNGLDLNGTFINNGIIMGGTGEGIDFDNLNGTFINNGTISSATNQAIEFDVDIEATGIFINNGTITSGGGGEAIEFSDDLIGTFINNGSIISTETGATGDGIEIDEDLFATATFINNGLIQGTADGIEIEDNLRGTIENSGSIIGNIGINIQDDGTGTILNKGGRIQGTGGTAVFLGTDNGIVILEGPSLIQGTLNGEGGAGDVLRFQNMRGITNAKKNELIAQAAADTDDTINLFANNISYINFEDIQVDLSTLVSYESLTTRPQLKPFAQALDNVQGLSDDDFREFLTALNYIDITLLDEALRSSSGLSTLNAITDLAQNFDVALYQQLMNQLNGGSFGSNPFNFSSLHELDSQSMQQLKQNLIALDSRGASDVSTLDRASVAPLGENDLMANLYLTGYTESGYQEQTGDRSKSSSIRGSVLLGSGSWLTENLYLGGFAGYTKSDARVDIFDSSLTTHSAHAGLNASYNWNNWFANVMAGVGYHGIYTTRWNAANQQFNAETDGYQGMVMSQLGYNWLNHQGTSRFTPYVGMSYSTLHIDGHTETSGTPGAALRFDDGMIDTLQTTLGFNYTRHYDTFFGFVRPIAGASWWHAFQESNTFAMSMATPGLLNNFSVESSNRNRDRAVYHLGVTVGLDELDGWVFHFAYQGSTGSEGYQSHGGTAGARRDF